MDTTEAWRDRAVPIAIRVRDLLARMTVEEKAAQLGSRWLGNTPREFGPDSAPMEQAFAASTAVALEQAARHGLGHLTRVYGSAPVSPAQGAAELARQQEVVVAGSRFGIPAIAHEECLTGVTAYGATVYPAAIAWAASFDPDLVGEMAAAIGHDLAGLGVHQGLSPLMDVVRDYRWGRVEETLGEDPYLVAELGSAYVRGLEGAGIVATLKHFAGYAASRAGRNHGPVSAGRRELLDVVLPPFEAAVAAGARSVMHSYNDVDSVPAGVDDWLLTEILREQWGFTGTVVSDYWATPFLALMHKVVPDHAGAAEATLRAGTDVELPDTLCFAHLPDLVRAGRVEEALLDRAVTRVLTQKAELGLLDADRKPAVDPPESLDAPVNRDIARRLADASIILLDPGTALPIGEPPSRMLVVGPCADDARTFMGCYAFPNHVLPKFPEHAGGLGIPIPTALDALRAEFPGTELSFEVGCDVMGDDPSGIPAAVTAAAGADLVVAFVGDRAGMFGGGTSGEGCDVDDLRLPGRQEELVTRLLDTGTPVVVVVVSGRPYALGDLASRTAGLVQAFMPGAEGGAALAGVLSGRIDPGGRLPVQIPRRPGGQPFTYLQPPLGEPSTISSVDTTPLFPFGHGLSYHPLELGEFSIDREEVDTAGEIEVRCVVRNPHEVPGSEVVQLYLSDPVASVVRPVRWLAGFARVRLEAGESAEVVFRVHADRTALVDRDLRRVVEPGEIEVAVGTSSRDLPHHGPVRLTGPRRVVGHDRELRTPVRIAVL
ncbi:beta-glucosidase [Kineosporia succinea]|uniref:Beta-glucosidase n=1 Tax=Kineosporia succinea TaxID=84632 RepID=A0ABT9P645_9ACTN|nr:glycoside hydrolase family 3 N-terminal domain-containing protein [Kineosporia succinea]MDP9828154.1 beta-glucosidase [Kineosporia succinea]